MVRARRLRSAYNAVSAHAEDDDDDNNAGAVVDEENEVFVDEEDDNSSAVVVSGDVQAPPQQRRVVGRRSKRQYQTVSTDGDAATDGDDDDDTVSSVTKKKEDGDDKTVTEDEEDDEEEGTKVTVVILDPAQKKFHIPAYSHWTIATFKQKSQRVHKVPPLSQRLIYRGQLLQDDKTLAQVGLTTDHLIVHLFPKPRVVIQPHGHQQRRPAGTGTCSAAGDDAPEDEEAQGGAHIPQIVLNADEAEQRATILVLGSADFLEAQNNVKLFSFLLLVISSIELFNLILILMGVPPGNGNPGGGGGSDAYDNSEDDFFHIDVNRTDAAYNNNYGGGGGSNNFQQPDPYEQQQIQEEMQTWHPRNNVDFVISALGVYVALLGIRATNETTLRIAKQYLVGTVVVGISWMMFNYWFTVHVDEEFDQLRRDERHNRTQAPGNSTDGDDDSGGIGPSDTHYDDDAIPYKTDMEYYQQNLSLMMIPGMVWILCCVRAWQFQSLLGEAEREAEERIRNELEQHRVIVSGTNSSEDDDSGDMDNNADEEAPPQASRNRRGRGRASDGGGGDDTDLELQNASAVIT